MATLFADSTTSATQDFTFWDNIGGTPASEATTVKYGPRSIKMTDASATSLTSATKNLSNLVFRATFWYRFDTLPSSGNQQYLFASTTSGFATDMLHLYIDSAGKMNLFGDSATGSAVVGTKVFAVNTWYRLTLSISVTDSTHWSAKFYYATADATTGALDITAGNANFTLGTVSPVWLGFMQYRSGGSGTVNVYFTGLYIDDSSALTDPGDYRITGKRPNANGTTNGFTTQIGAGGSGYGTGHSPQVNEQPLSQTNGWSMIGAGSAITEEYNIEGVATGDIDITGKTIVDSMGWVYAKSLSSETGSIVLKGSATNISLTSTPTMFTKFAASSTYPAGSGTDIGIVTTTALTTVSLYECGIQVIYDNASTDDQSWRTPASDNYRRHEVRNVGY